MALAWKAGWGQPLGSSNLPSSALEVPLFLPVRSGGTSPLEGRDPAADTAAVLRGPRSAANRSQVMQPDHRQRVGAELPAGPRQLVYEEAGEVGRVPPRPVQLAERDRVVPSEVQGQRPALRSVGAQRGEGLRIELDLATATGLRRALVQVGRLALLLDDGEAAPHLDGAAVEVEVPPAQREQLAAAHPGHRQHPPGQGRLAVDRRAPGEEAGQLVGSPHAHLGRPGPGRRRGSGPVDGVRRQDALPHRIGQCLAQDRETYRSVRADSPPVPSARPSRSRSRIHRSTLAPVSFATGVAPRRGAMCSGMFFA